MKATTWLGVEAKKAKPTKKHRPAMWECMLGAVYAMNDDREVKYFDYDYEAARAFAGVSSDRDPRLFKNKPPTRRWAKINPRPNQLVLWIREQ